MWQNIHRRSHFQIENRKETEKNTLPHNPAVSVYIENYCFSGERFILEGIKAEESVAFFPLQEK